MCIGEHMGSVWSKGIGLGEIGICRVKWMGRLRRDGKFGKRSCEGSWARLPIRSVEG